MTREELHELVDIVMDATEKTKRDLEIQIDDDFTFIDWGNVLHIPEGGDYEVQNFQLTMNKHRSTDFHFSTNTHLLGICCYSQCF